VAAPLWVTNIQRFSIHDGPGIRTTVFLQGCPLRCRWCQNPECLTPGPQLKFTRALCVGCAACVHVCPQSCHSAADGEHRVERAACTKCGRCAAACPTRALEIIGEQRTPEEIMAVVARDRAFYETSGGGVTLSGGEPLEQAEGVVELLRLARERGIHTAVETCGSVEWYTVEAVLAHVDLWLYDLKHFDPAAHRAATGVGNRHILGNLARLLDAGAEVILRVPIIPTQNADDGFLSDLVSYVSDRPALSEVHLMPYNRLAEPKYEAIGMTYALRDLEQPADAVLEAVKRRLEAAGKVVRIGG
jgi:pyruvate formate lyase activating enzyme